MWTSLENGERSGRGRSYLSLFRSSLFHELDDNGVGKIEVRVTRKGVGEDSVLPRKRDFD